MSTKRLLLAGETFTLVQAAVSGLSVGQSSRYVNGATHFLAAMQGTNFAIEQLPSERCEADFPRTLEELQGYSAVILSDVGALTLLFTPESRQGHVSVNRLALLCDFVRIAAMPQVFATELDVACRPVSDPGSDSPSLSRSTARRRIPVSNFAFPSRTNSG
jgi:hypothetical protein